MIDVFVTAAPYCTLCNKTIAELAGVEPYLIKRWVNALSSLLYRDEVANQGICVWHLSIYNFFISDCCNYQVNV